MERDSEEEEGGSERDDCLHNQNPGIEIYVTSGCSNSDTMLNLSFAGCGFLGIYHLGVAMAIARHGRSFLAKVDRFAGASAGSLVAATLCLKGSDTRVIQDCVGFCTDLVRTVRKKKMGVLTPGASLLDPLENFLDSILPENAHELATNKLFISVTVKKENKLVSEFHSRSHLLQCLLGSSYVPFVTGAKAVKVEHRRVMDGGMTNNLPILPDGRTVLVSPFSGHQDICPEDKVGLGWFCNINKQDFQVNRKNIIRGMHAFFPPEVHRMDGYYERGIKDAINFLKSEGCYEEEMPPPKQKEVTASVLYVTSV